MSADENDKGPMDAQFWLGRWQEGRIGFHEGAPNAFLVQHAHRLGPPGRVLVPLCGKAEDMAWLAAHGHQVVGVELSPVAAEAFFVEHGFTPERSRRGAFDVFSANGVEILVGDFFALEPETVGEVTAVYDRAALVAIPPANQPSYLAKLRALVVPGTPCLLVTFEYDQQKMEGPPFSVPGSALTVMSIGKWDGELLETRAVQQMSARLREANVGRMDEAVWLLQAT